MALSQKGYSTLRNGGVQGLIGNKTNELLLHAKSGCIVKLRYELWADSNFSSKTIVHSWLEWMPRFSPHQSVCSPEMNPSPILGSVHNFENTSDYW
jgi:hypothetical protein